MSSKSVNINKIPTTPPADTAQDYYALRSLGISLLSQVGTDNWTDFNAHDPGITMLETVCYAITDLGYRAAFPVEDIIAQSKMDTAELKATSIHTAAEVLPSSPVSLNDFRKVLIDQPGVSNAWIYKVNHYQPFKGLRKVVVQLTDAHPQPDTLDAVTTNLQAAFWANRNLGEALETVEFLQPRALALDLQVVVAKGVVPEQVLAAAIVKMSEFLEGRVKFLTLSQMLAQTNGDVAQAFEGPLLQHGFLPDSHLSPKVTTVDPDQLIRCIRDVPGLESVVGLRILTRLDPNWDGSSVQWVGGDGRLNLEDNEFPVFDDLDKFRFVVTQSQRQYPVNHEDVAQDVEHLQSLQAVSKQANLAADLPIPLGKYRDLEQYYSIQYDFPSIYNLRPGAQSYSPDAKRLGETNQLRGYLLLIDQVLANYLSQLGNVFALFSWDSSVKATYFFQGLEYTLHGMLQMLVGMPEQDIETANAQTRQQMLDGLARFKQEMAGLRETKEEFLARRGRFLNHLLARFGRSLEYYVSRLPSNDREAQPAEYNATAERFLLNYPALSSRRGTGGNPLLTASPETVKPGLQQLIETIFDVPVIDPQRNASYGRFTILGNPDIAIQRLFGQHVLTTDDASPINLPFLMNIAIREENYRIVEDADDPNLFTLRLFGDVQTDQPGGLYTFVNAYPSVGQALRAIQASVKLFREFSLASERLYFIDHILLRPFAENPAFGLQVFAQDLSLLLANVGWYPRAALEKTAELSSGNSVVAYSGVVTSGTTFVFRILAEQNGKPYPVYSPKALPLPSTFSPASPTVTSVSVSQWMRDYILRYYPDLIANGKQLGTMLKGDFYGNKLPDDWVSGGKADVMQTWGMYALQDIFSRWKANVASIGDALLAAIGGTAQSVDALPAPEDKALLVGYAKAYYAAKFTTGETLANALAADLAGKQPPSAGFTLDARVYLAATGLALGKAYCERYFGPSPIDAERLGNGMALSFGWMTPKGMEEALQINVAANLVSIYLSIYPPIAGKDFLSQLLAPVSSNPLIGSGSDNGVTISGRDAWATWIRVNWPVEVNDPVRLGAAIQVWLQYHSGPAKQEPSQFANLTNLITAGIIPYLSEQADKAQGNAGKLGDAVKSDLLAAGLPPSGLVSTLQTAGLKAMQWYLRNVVASTDLGGNDVTALAVLNRLGLVPKVVDSSLWELGTKALAFYLNNVFGGKVPAADDLGKRLMADFSLVPPPPDPKPVSGGGGDTKSGGDSKSGGDTKSLVPVTVPLRSDPVAVTSLAAVGGYTLSEYLETVILPLVPKGGTAGSVLIGTYYTLPPKTDINTVIPKVSDGAAAVVKNAKTDIVAIQQGQTASADLYHLVNSANMAQFLLDQGAFADPLPAKVDAQLAVLQTGAKVSTINDPMVVQSLAHAGYLFLRDFILSRWSWQLVDPTVLGAAVLTLLPASPPPVAPLGPGLPAAPAAAVLPVTYHISLAYTSTDGIPVEFYSTVQFPSEADAVQQITWLQTAIPKVQSGQLAFSAVFKPLLMPEATGDGTGSDQALVADPYSSVLTVIGPDWPLRFQERGFKDRLVQAVAEEAPAHFWTQFLWLNKQEMQVFEGYYTNWVAEGIDDIARDLYGRKIAQLILQKSIAPQPQLQIPGSDES